MITLSFASKLLMTCGGEKAPVTETEEEIEESTANVDSASVEMHNSTEDIEKTSAEFR